MSFDAQNIVFFFGAGASAPFGIPTMKQMVIDFEKELSEKGSEEEKDIYDGIKSSLEVDFLGDHVDLEAIFTVIDGIVNYNIERLGLLSLYSAKTTFGKLLTNAQPLKNKISTCEKLKEKFQNFVREKCLPPEESYDKISRVYRDFFNRLWQESGMRNSSVHRSSGPYLYCTTWTIFTTNYDTCLEHYWRQVARVELNTGFSFEESRRISVLNPDLFIQRNFRLFKLHGSISWQIEHDGTVTEEQTIMGRSLVGRHFVGEMMIYPIQQKELYLEPYVSMIKELNSELRKKSIWIIIGYSFNDPVIHEIFIRNSDKTKKIILLHPDAQEIKEQKFANCKCEQIMTLNKKFGEDDFKPINYLIVNSLIQNPRHSAQEDV